MNAIKCTISENGINQIHQFLAGHHKKGGDYFDRSMLKAFVEEAEFQLAEGNPPSIELSSWETVSGRTETFTISDEGLDFEEIEIEDY
jgi:hypothetical protein